MTLKEFFDYAFQKEPFLTIEYLEPSYHLQPLSCNLLFSFLNTSNNEPEKANESLCVSRDDSFARYNRKTNMTRMCYRVRLVLENHG